MSWLKRRSTEYYTTKSSSSLSLKGKKKGVNDEEFDDGRSNCSDDSGLDPLNSTAQLRPMNSEIAAPRIDSYRFSMANLEDSQDVDLDAILGELCALETECDRELGFARASKRHSADSTQQKVAQQTILTAGITNTQSTPPPTASATTTTTTTTTQQHFMPRTHSRSSSETPRIKLDNAGDADLLNKTVDSVVARTESPDNDSAFSDTVSMLSSESSASSGGSGAKPQSLHISSMQDEASRIKAEKIRMAMEKIKEANIQKLFVKVFTADGSAKSLLVDEKMLCSYVTRLLADKNHVQMDPKWAIVEHIPDLYMERIYEDHELIVENLMMWTRESKNKIYFSERPEKYQIFIQPEKFLLPLSDNMPNKKESYEYDEHARTMLLEEFFSANAAANISQIEGPLYLKADSKKGWKRYNFVLRASGLYYYPKEKVKSAKDLICLATFENNQVYYGLGWKKKYKAPTDFCFAVKHPRLQEPKSTKYIKYLCAEDRPTLERWMVGMRIAKYGKQLMENYRALMDELAQEDLDILAHARSCSVSSIAVQSAVTTPTQGYPGSEAGYGTQSETYSAPSELSSGRHSRASSSSSSGCMSDGAPSSCENAFDSEFPMGTIKRKPSMKPSLPLTNITRQLKEVGETRDEIDGGDINAKYCEPVSSNSGTLTRRHSRRKSNSTDDSSNSGTLKRQHSYKSRGSIESMGGGGTRSGNSTPLCQTPVRDRVSPFPDRPSSATSLRSNSLSPSEMPSCMTDSITSLPPPPPPETSADDVIINSPSYQLPPPPPPQPSHATITTTSSSTSDIYNSNLSLDSLPPPPTNLGEFPLSTAADDELTGSQLSLMSLPPPPPPSTTTQHQLNIECGTIRRKKDMLLSPDQTPTNSPTQSRLGTPTHFSPPPPSLSTNSSGCSTPTQLNPPTTFSPCHGSGQNHDRNNQFSYNRNTLPCATGNLGNAFSSANGLRSSMRQNSLPRQISSNSIASSTTTNSSSSSSATTTLNECNKNTASGGSATSSSPKKQPKKISFNLVPQEVPPLPMKKPPPPKRSDSTKLSSPKKLVEPPVDFLKDLQRVMRKKWQVAQKCKLEPTTTPHEVLGFRDPPILLPDYKEHNVSNWVQEHYGPNNVYENVYRDDGGSVVEYATSPVHSINRVSGDYGRGGGGKRAPPPPPPKRSDTTQLTTTPKLY